MRILNDFTTSVKKSLDEIDPNWQDYPGLLVCGTHNPHMASVESALDEIKKAREEGTPFLGICFGMQLMAVEYVRNALGNPEATSQEFVDDKIDFVIRKMPELRVGIHPAMVNMQLTTESFWHNYKVDIDNFKLGTHFFFNEANDVVTWMKLKDRENFFGVQFHPEYQSSKDKPHPVLVEFINLCKNHGK